MKIMTNLMMIIFMITMLMIMIQQLPQKNLTNREKSHHSSVD